MATRLTKKQWEQLLERDGGYCLHCGRTEALAPNHRMNRGMGGSKTRHRPSNWVLLCSSFNGRIEDDSYHRDEAIRSGWKLESWQTFDTPVLDACTGIWWLLDDEFGRVECEPLIFE